MDPHFSEKLDQDPHLCEKPDPDKNLSDADLQPWEKVMGDGGSHSQLFPVQKFNNDFCFAVPCS